MKSLFTILFFLITVRSSAQQDSTVADTLNLWVPVPQGDEIRDGDQDISPALFASPDVFMSAGFALGAGRYRARGIQQAQRLFINGAAMDDPESGGSVWSGLNDILRFWVNRYGLHENRNGISTLAGYTAFDATAASFKKMRRITVTGGNSVYNGRLMVTIASGVKPGGWGFVVSGNQRYGSKMQVPGTRMTATSAFASVSHQWSRLRCISLNSFFNYSNRGISLPATTEACTLANDPLYNDQWGLQNGKMRNPNTRASLKSTTQLHLKWDLSDQCKIRGAAWVAYHHDKSGGLNWYDVQPPMPDYYKYLPGMYFREGDHTTGDRLTNEWLNNVNTRQIDFDRMIGINRSNLYALPGEQNITNEKRSLYIVDARHAVGWQEGANITFQKFWTRFTLSSGVHGSYYRSRNYKTLVDLLGGDYWLDYDQFVNATDGVTRQNNLSQPDKKIRQGDKMGYEYNLVAGTEKLWTQGEWHGRRIEFVLAAWGEHFNVFRQGDMANGKFPLNSAGQSARIKLNSGGVRLDVSIKITGRQYIMANALWMVTTPPLRTFFISPETRNDLTQNVGQPKTTAFDIGYEARYPTVRARFTLYSISMVQMTKVMSFWHDQYNTTVNMVVRNVAQRHIGLETGIEKTIALAHKINLAIGIGDWRYSTRPSIDAWQSNNATPIYLDRVSYLKNYKVGGSPQTVASIAYRYTSVRKFYAGIHCSWFGDNYVDPQPERRTEEALARFLSSEARQFLPIVQQTKLKDYYLVNMTIGKSFRLQHKYNVSIGLNVSNLLNRRDIILSGSESARWDAMDLEKFANKYMHLPGIGMMLNMTISYS